MAAKIEEKNYGPGSRPMICCSRSKGEQLWLLLEAYVYSPQTKSKQVAWCHSALPHGDRTATVTYLLAVRFARRKHYFYKFHVTSVIFANTPTNSAESANNSGAYMQAYVASLPWKEEQKKQNLSTLH